MRTASASCFGGVCSGRAPPGVVRCALGVERCRSLCGGSSSCVWALVPVVVSSFSAPRSLFLPLRGAWVVSCSHVVSLPVPCPCRHFGPFLAPLPECPFLSLALPLPVPFPFLVWWWWGGGGGLLGADGQGLGLGGLERMAEGFGGCIRGAGPGPRRGGGPLTPPAAWWRPGRPRWGLRGCGRRSPRSCAPCAPLRVFPLPRPTSPSSGAPARRGQTTRRGGRGPGGERGLSLRPGSGGRRMWTYGGGGRGGAWGSGSGGGGGWGWRTGTGGRGKREALRGS